MLVIRNDMYRHHLKRVFDEHEMVRMAKTGTGYVREGEQWTNDEIVLYSDKQSRGRMRRLWKAGARQ